MASTPGLRAALVSLSIAAFASTAAADGKVYARERVPPGVPYQRACIFHEAGMQTLILQTAFLPDSKQHSPAFAPAPAGNAATPSTHGGPAPPTAAYGWVVPVPSVPELSAGDPSRVDHFFHMCDRFTTPRLTDISTLIPTVLFFVLLVALILGLMLGFAAHWKPALRPFFHRRIGGVSTIAVLLLCLFLAALLLPALAKAGAGGGVEVVKSEQVGSYDASVLRATNNGDLIAWLDDHGFTFTESDRPVIDRYIEREWCFVVAAVRESERSKLDVDPGRLLDPLIMRFSIATPVYPLALTATVGSDTEVLVYLISDVKRSAGERLPLRRASTRGASLLEDAAESRFLPPAFCEWRSPACWISKFKGTLTPEQMRQDLVFLPANDSSEYREHVVRW